MAGLEAIRSSTGNAVVCQPRYKVREFGQLVEEPLAIPEWQTNDVMAWMICRMSKSNGTVNIDVQWVENKRRTISARTLKPGGNIIEWLSV